MFWFIIWSNQILQQKYEKWITRKSNNRHKTIDDLIINPTEISKIGEEIHEIYSLIDKNKIKSAESKIAKLRDKIGEDPDLVRADVLIRRKEIIGK